MTIGNRSYNTLTVQELRQLKDEVWIELDKIDEVIKKKKEDKRASLEEKLLSVIDEIFASGYSIRIYDPDEEYDDDDDEDIDPYDRNGKLIPTKEYSKEDLKSGVEFSVT